MAPSPDNHGLEDSSVRVVMATTHAATLLTACDTLLSPDERAQRQRLVFEHDRRLATLSRGMRRLLLARETGVSPDALLFQHGTYGKPELTSDPDVRFNVSHSGNVVAIALARGREVGIDVEAIRADRDLDAIASYSFSDRERRDLAALAPELYVQGFYGCWTQKEAFLKLLGAGLHCPLDAFDVEVSPARQPALRALRMTATNALPCRMARIPVGDGYTASLAIRDTPAVECVLSAWYPSEGAPLSYRSLSLGDRFV